MKYQYSKTRINLLYAGRVSPHTGPGVQCAMRRALCDQSGLTLVEMLLSLALIGIVFAAILPQFRAIMGSWDSKQGAAEALQNGRVLMDHLNRNLTTAVKITAVSESSETSGYIEFEDNGSNNLRYDVDVNSYVEFGAVGDLYELAGPVSLFQFTCYDACDLDTPLEPITDVNIIRFVKAETTLTNSASLGQDKTFSTSVYLRVNGNPGSGGSPQTTTYDYSNRTQGTDIFAYDGENATQAPTNPTTPSTVLSAAEYDGIETDNGSFHSFSSSTHENYAQMRFVIQIDEDQSDVTQITATWNGKGVNTQGAGMDGASFYIWDYSSSSYELLQAGADTEAEVTLSGTAAGSPDDYIGGAGDDTVTLLSVTNDSEMGATYVEVFTDYIKLEITVTIGGDGVSP